MVSIKTEFWNDNLKLKWLMLFIAGGNGAIHLTNMNYLFYYNHPLLGFASFFMVFFNGMIIYSAFKHRNINRSFEELKREVFSDGKKREKDVADVSGKR